MAVLVGEPTVMERLASLRWVSMDSLLHSRANNVSTICGSSLLEKFVVEADKWDF
jgi:hypothetical protein